MTRDPARTDVVVTRLGRGIYRVDEGSRSRVAYAAAADDTCWVFLDGRVFLVEQDHDAGRSAELRTRAPRRESAQQPPTSTRQKRGEHPSDLAAPMPATVVNISVAPGQRVSRGDVLVMLEAMKMELPIKAPRDGTVKSISCRPGELVQAGVPLLELE